MCFESNLEVSISVSPLPSSPPAPPYSPCVASFLHLPFCSLPPVFLPSSLLIPVSTLSLFRHLFPSCRERMKLPFMTDQCEQMLKISNEFVRLQVSYDEYLCMKVLLLLSTGNGNHNKCFSNYRPLNYSGIKLDLEMTFMFLTLPKSLQVYLALH